MSHNPSKIGEYTIKKVIGSGHFGVVYRVTNKKGEDCALKKLFKDSYTSGDQAGAVLSEIQLLASIDHMCILKYIDSFKDKDTGQWCILTELCKEDLRKVIQRNEANNQPFSENEIFDYFAMLASAIDYLHSKHVMHRDIKPENVLIGANNILKLSDFGIAKLLVDKDTATFAGALRYMAPEIKRGVNYNEKCDVWSLGILIMELCFLKIEDASVDTISSRYSRGLQRSIKIMLEPNPEKRPNSKVVFRMPPIQSRLAEIEARSKATNGSIFTNRSASDEMNSATSEYDVLGTTTTVDSTYIRIHVGRGANDTTSSTCSETNSAIENLTSFLGGVTVDGKKPVEVPQTVHDLVYCEASGIIYVTDQQRISGYKWDQDTRQLKLAAFRQPGKQIESIAMATQDGIGCDQIYMSVGYDLHATKHVFRMSGKDLKYMERLTTTDYINEDEKCYTWELASDPDRNLLLIHPSFTSVIYIHIFELRYQKVNLEQAALPSGIRQINLIGRKLILGNYWFNTLYICDLIVGDEEVYIEFSSQWGPVKAAQGCFGAIPYNLGEEGEKLYVITKTGSTRVSAYRYKILGNETNFVPEPIQTVDIKESLTPMCVIVPTETCLLVIGKSAEDKLCAVELKKREKAEKCTIL